MTGVIVSKSKMQGKGVFATRDFKKGEKVLRIDDSHMVSDLTKLTARQHEYDLDYLDRKIVLMQSPEKYINHSCDPNAFTKTIRGVRQVIARRQIRKGEEITYDYVINGDNEGSFPCRCGSARCRGTYQGNFFKLPPRLQREYLPLLDNWFKKKHQPAIAALRQQCRTSV